MTSSLGCRYHVDCDGHAIFFKDPSLTKQSFKDECDINLIIKRAANGADISHLNSRAAQYGDFSNVPDYRAALDVVRNANDLFMSFDADIRERFANDPARFLAFASNPANAPELIKLGLAVDKTPPPPPAPAPAGPGISGGVPPKAAS